MSCASHIARCASHIARCASHIVDLRRCATHHVLRTSGDRRSSISGGAQHIMCCAPLAIVDRRSPEVRNTRAVPAGERLLARNRRFTCGSVAGRKVYGETGSAGCLRATAALRADPSSDGKFTVKQVRRVACDQPPPPSPNGTTPTHTTEYSSTESVLLNPNRRHPNPPNDYCFRKLGSPCV